MERKEPITSLPLDYHAHEHVAGAVMVLIGLLALAGVVFAIVPLAVIAGVFAGFAGLVWLLLHLVVRRMDRALTAMSHGQYLVHWEYEPQQWQAYLQQRTTFRLRVLAAIPAAMVVVGLVLGGLMHSDQNLVSDSVLLTYLVPVGIATVAGGMMDILLMTAERYTRHMTGSRQPRFVLGEEGFYLGGDYWPWSMPGQGVSGVRLQQEPQPHLAFDFDVTAGRTRTGKTVRVPIPPGREEEARQIINRLTVEDEEEFQL